MSSNRTEKLEVKKRFWIGTAILLLLAVLLSAFYEVRWYGYILIAVLFVAFICGRLFFTREKWQRVVAWVLVIVLSIGSALLCRPDHRVSVAGNTLNNGYKLVNNIYFKSQGISLWADFMHDQIDPYVFGDWEAPAGYTNEQIDLPNARGYLLKNENGNHEKVVYQIHGGGYVNVFNDTYNEVAVKFSKMNDDCDVFSLDYRTAPDNKYPCALEDAVDGYSYLLEQGYEPDNIIVCGDSAGGGLSLAMTLYLRDYGIALPKALILSSPWADLSSEGESYRTKILDDPFFGSADPEKAPEHPVPIVYAENEDLHNPYISPIYGDYTGMPQMLIQTGENELLLSDSDSVAAQAEKAGVDVEYIVYPGMFHTFYILYPDIPEGRAAYRVIADYISSLY